MPLSSTGNARINILAPKDIVFNPPVIQHAAQSPCKSYFQRTLSPLKPAFCDTTNVSLPLPQVPAFVTDSPAKKSTVSMFHPIAPQKPQKALFNTFPYAKSMDKENFNPAYLSDNFAEFPDPSYVYKAPLERTLLEAAPLQDRQFQKPQLEDLAVRHLPEPQNMPQIEDDGTKPPYSYAALIGMSILRAQNRRLTLAQIYKWISDTFSYYRVSESGWQNSIRHNLSLNKAFIKQERPKDDPGKGNYWAIEPGMESQFVKDKPSRRSASSFSSSMKMGSQPSSETNASAWGCTSKSTANLDVGVTESFEPSSDATIPASDAAFPEDVEEVMIMPPPSSRFPPSSPLQAIHSSPPVVRRLSPCASTPLLAPNIPSSSSMSGSRKRKMAAMNDSGYFSSLESSATRPYPNGNPVTSVADMEWPRIKRGRAEEEIARIRSSSHDISPLKGRAILRQPTPQIFSSSPLRHFDSSVMLPPLTPASAFKLPAKPPASISPNTNLRNHRNRIRELVGSPVKSMTLLHDEIPFSPAFNIVEDEFYVFEDNLNASSNVFTAKHENGFVGGSLGSPQKRSVRRPRIDRASTTLGVLVDATGINMNSRAISPAFRAPCLDSPTLRMSPAKSPHSQNNIIDVSKDELFGLDLSAEEDTDDFGGLDILQGFRKIGRQDKENVGAVKLARPLLGARNHTSRF
ncbi:hypothetical protein MMC12_001993 [Toensbergia leucococca]|nr:hypothetical protein [Toensbergia leucococca]